LAVVFYDAGRVGEALAAFRTAEKLEPPVAWGLQFMSIFLIHQGRTEEASHVIQRWGEVVGYRNPDLLQVVLRAFDDSAFTGEALAALEDVWRTTGLRAGDLVSLYLNLHAPAEALGVVQEAIAQRHVFVPWLGKNAFTRDGVLESPEIKAALEEIGVRIN
jgi:hypothetical protein